MSSERFKQSYDREKVDTIYRKQVQRLRLEDFDTLNRMCKMHLSFVLDLNAEKFEALLGEKDDERPRISLSLYRIRSMKNSETSIMEGRNKHAEVGTRVTPLINFLQSGLNLQHEGIFRKSGSIVRQKDLRDKLTTGESVDFTLGYYTAHDCASVLKSLLSDLPEPLLQERLCSAHMSLSDVTSHENRIKAASLLLQMLPSDNFSLASDILNLLHQVSRQAHKNRMSADNLGAVFAPHLLCPRKMSSADLQNQATAMQTTLSFLIEYTSEVLRVPEMLGRDAVNHLRESSINASCSEESMLDGSVMLSTRKSKHWNHSDEQPDEPLHTVVTFTERRSCSNSQDTAVELAKLYAHVQAMPESAKKRKLMKQFNEANGYNEQVERQRKHSRSRSLGESIKRRFSRHRRQKSMNISTDRDILSTTCNENNNSVLHNGEAVQRFSDAIHIMPLAHSPYPLHKNSRKKDSMLDLGNHGNTQPYGSCQAMPYCTDLPSMALRGQPDGGLAEVGTCSRALPVPAIRKTLLPCNLNATPDMQSFRLKKVTKPDK